MHARTVGPNPSIQIRLQSDLWSAVESFRRNEPDIPTRPEAVRRLVQRALDVTLDPAICTKGRVTAANYKGTQAEAAVLDGGRP